MSKDIYTPEIERQRANRHLARRPFLQAVAGAGAFGLSTGVASAGHETDECDATIEFNRAKVARVSDVRAAGLTDLTIFAFHRDGEPQKHESVDPTENGEYGSLRVRYAPGADTTIVQVGGPNSAIRRVVAYGSECRSAKTNPLDSAVGENEAPSADFKYDPERPIVGEQVTFTSTASDPDGALIHYGWDFDDDGGQDATGETVTHAFGTAGDRDVTHTVIDDFDAMDSVTRTVSVEAADRFEQTAKLIASDGQPDDEIGVSVSVDGDTALLGAQGEDGRGDEAGAAYVFTRNGGTWTEEAKLTANDGAAYDRFGHAVSMDGDTAVIGAMGDDDLGTSAGAVYVFTRDSNGEWSEQSKLTASDGKRADQFGYSVSVDGDTALLGAQGEDGRGDEAGAAYVFTRNEGTWTEEAKLTANDGAAYDRFGHAVSVDGDTALVGAFQRDDTTGAAYVFTRDPNGKWGEQSKLTASDREEGDRFGFSVSVDGDTALLGAYGEDEQGQEAGAAYVFARSEETWTEEAKLTADDGERFQFFGISASVGSGVVIVGALGLGDPDDDRLSPGSAYVFTQSGGDWTEQSKLTASDGEEGDQFGHSVSVEGDTALVGARVDEVQDNNVGAAYVFSK